MRFKLLLIFPARIVLLLSLMLLSRSVSAQPQADFNPSKTGGCSPLFISFTNTTTNASANAVYRWDFGNGNTSTLKDPGAVFDEERAYTISLTVTDGAHTSTKTKTITVYKRPSADFTYSPEKGCLPLTADFNSTASAGDGNITSWRWDFGDGVTLQSLVSTISHAYQFPQTATVSLTATNNFGCSHTTTKPGIITVLPAIQAAFSANRTLLCDAPGTVQFTNGSTGPGTLSYEWDFGDGNTSTLAAPSHTYTQNGLYTVKLTVRNSEGCTNVLTKNSYIRVGGFNTDFQVPPLVCTDRIIWFNNTSTPTPGQCTWVFDGAYTLTSFGNAPVITGYATPGTHTVQLTSTYGANCQQTITKTIEVKSTPKLNGFIADVTGICGAPVQVNFKDTTADAISWQWNFDWYTNNTTIHSTAQTASHTYTADRDYYVSLTVANADGCSANIRKTVHIGRPLVGIYLDTGYTNEGCAPFTTKFTTKSTEPIVSYSWNFGDGTPVSNDPEPLHTYVVPGIYDVVLTYTTVNGCTGTAIYNSAKARQKPAANFIVPATVCGNTPVQFSNQTTGYTTAFYWYFGDPTGFSSTGSPSYQYQEQGDYTVTLVAYNALCNDTMVKSNIIKVLPPFPQIQAVTNTCNGTRGTVTFNDNSRQTDSWHWSFGDATSTSYTSPQATVSHTYNATGTYKVVLTTVNGACTVKDSTLVYVLLKQNPALTANKTEICLEGGSLNLQVSNLQRSTIPQSWLPPHYFYKVIKSDGSNFNGTIYSPGWDNIPWNATLTYFSPGDETLRVVTRSNLFNCTDTTNAIPIRVKGPEAAFTIPNQNVCFKSPVLLRDASIIRYGVPIVKWQWNFGDGVIITTTQGGEVSHIYANPGSYPASLVVTDADGCVSDVFQAIVYVAGPKAAFIHSPGPNVQLNTTVNFTNTTNIINPNAATYLWNFGNGNTSTAHTPPAQVYTVPGEYVITLITENTTTQCRDTARKTITVANFNTGFTKNVSFIGDQSKCPPVLARFTNTSTNYTRLVWDFGDGLSLEDQHAPSHIYHIPGVYPVTLYVYGFNGLTGVYRDTIFVRQPQASIQADDSDGCIGHQVLLNSPVHANVSAWLWDLGDGRVISPADSFATHQYMTPGEYAPSVFVTDGNGCTASASLADKIIIHPDPVITIEPAAPVACKGSAVQLQANGANAYSWSPASGLNNTGISSPLASPVNTTTYTVNATDVNGCSNDTSVTVTVPEPFDLNGATDAGVCKGSSVQLNISGANTYQWIGNTAGLSNTLVANPLASPLNDISYIVVGYDAWQCFSDTARINIKVHALPSVQAGADLQVAYGSPTQLAPVASNDVVKWKWTPADYLDCTTCPAPVSRPQSEIDYVVMVTNNNSCTAKDTVSLKMICAEANIYIPNAFTPNRDGNNDVFTINGHGVRIIKSMRIYNRWGEVVFEKKNFYPNDNSSAWNGRFKGVEAIPGTYVYFAEMECEAGQVFQRKGTVTLVK